MKTNLFIIMAIFVLASCTKQPSTVTTTNVTNPLTSGNSTTTTSTTTTTCTTTNGVNTCTTTTTGNGASTTTSGCDGIPRANTSSCYYKNIPTVQVSGGLPGQTYWSSLNLSSAISQNQFVTDGTFNVRIIPRLANPNALSASGKVCSPFMVGNSKALKVQLMLRKQGVGLGEIQTLTSTNDTPSAVAHFTPPGGTTQPYILEVVSVLSDTRCTWAGGTSTLYCPYADIPINTLGPTQCVAFDIQYSTDNTYDLPN